MDKKEYKSCGANLVEEHLRGKIADQLTELKQEIPENCGTYLSMINSDLAGS